MLIFNGTNAKALVFEQNIILASYARVSETNVDHSSKLSLRVFVEQELRLYGKSYTVHSQDLLHRLPRRSWHPNHDWW